MAQRSPWWSEVDGLSQSAAVEYPRGIHEAKCDDKGRVKLPAIFQRYLTEIGATKVFITSFDGHIARIYTIPVWKQVENLLHDGGEDSEGAEDLWFTAQDYGSDVEMDAQGRVTMPSNLRRDMEIENQPVWLEHYRGHINVFGAQIYQQRKQRSAANRESALKKFEARKLP